MRHTFISIFFISFVLFFGSCNLFFDRDTTENISKVSKKPIITLLGNSIMSLPTGGTYVDPGVEAYVGDSSVNYTIVSGNVDPNQEGFYVVTYSAENEFGWTSYAYRAVLVYSGDAYGTDITGNYKVGFAFTSPISKHSVPGFWYMENVWAEENVVFPIYFADNGNDTYSIVPGIHDIKGNFSGTAIKSGLNIAFYINIVSPQGKKLIKSFTWTKY